MKANECFTHKKKMCLLFQEQEKAETNQASFTLESEIQNM